MEMHRQLFHQSKKINFFKISGAILSLISYVIYFCLIEYFNFNAQDISLFMWSALMYGLSLLTKGITFTSSKHQNKYIFNPCIVFFFLLPSVYLFNYFFDLLVKTKIPVYCLIITPILLITWYFARKKQ